MKRSVIIPILAIPIFLMTLISCSGNRETPYTETYFALGTVCTITLYEKVNDFKFIEAFEVIDKIEAKMSPVISGSELDMINSNAGLRAVKVSDETFLVIKEGIRYAEIDNSGFDISIGPLVNIWGIGTENQRVPEENTIKNLLPLVGSENIVLNSEDKSVYLTKKGMSIDLGGIAKGYAADEVKKFLLERGFTKGIINLGGNVLTFGEKSPGVKWKIGVQDPSDKRGNYIGTLTTGASAVVTSGIYERFFIEDGKRYHHILDPDSGYPVDNSLLSITIISDNAISADALSTVIFSEGLEKGIKLLETFPGRDGVFITKEKKVFTTTGIRESFNLNSPEFSMGN